MTSSFFDSVHKLKTKFPVTEETPVFMYKFIFLGIFAARQFKEIILLLATQWRNSCWL